MYHIITNPISGRKKNNLKRIQGVFDYLNENENCKKERKMGWGISWK